MPPKKETYPDKLSDKLKKESPKVKDAKAKPTSTKAKKDEFEDETEESDSSFTDSEEEEVSEIASEIVEEREMSDDDGEGADGDDGDENDDSGDENVKGIDDIETITKIDEGILSKSTRIRKLIPHDQRTISDRMTRYELANLIANRAKHIQMGAEIFIDIDNMDKEEDIAKKEIMTFNAKTGKSNCELYISRYSHSDDQFDYFENWYINEMIIPKF